jgi:hypothetical protein
VYKKLFNPPSCTPQVKVTIAADHKENSPTQLNSISNTKAKTTSQIFKIIINFDPNLSDRFPFMTVPQISPNPRKTIDSKLD